MVYVQCPDCLGTKEWRVLLPSGEEFQHDCRTCSRGYYSEGRVAEYGDRGIVVERTIGSIRVDTADENRPVSYMCCETGVGSGTVYDEKNLFLTKQEADTWVASELERVKGLRQAEELRQRKVKKSDPLIHGKRRRA